MYYCFPQDYCSQEQVEEARSVQQVMMDKAQALTTWYLMQPWQKKELLVGMSSDRMTTGPTYNTDFTELEKVLF